MANWRLPVSYAVAIPLGVILWGTALIYNLHDVQKFRQSLASHRTALAHRGYRRIAARTLMNLGIGLAFRSWLTLIVAAALVPFYIEAAKKRRQYIDYLRSGILSDAFPDRISKH